MRAGIALALLTAGLLAQAARGPEAFEVGLDRIRELMRKGKFAEAGRDVDDLLMEHACKPYAVARAAEIVELVRECAFREDHPPPRPHDLVSGRLISYDLSKGRLSISYETGNWGDFEEKQGTYVHSARFSGGHTVLVKGRAYGVGGPPPVLMVCADDQSGYVISFGAARQERYPAIIREIGPATQTDLAKGRSLCEPGRPYTLKVVVAERSIQVFWNNRRMLRAAKPDFRWGQVAVRPGATQTSMRVEGRAEPSWLQSKIDAADQERREEFFRTCQPESRLPSWLFRPADEQEESHVADTRRWPVKPEGWGRAMVANVEVKLRGGDPAAALDALETVPAGKVPEILLDSVRALVLWDLGRFAESAEACGRVNAADETFLPAFELRAEALRRLGKTEEALALHRALRARFPRDADLHARSALFLLRSGAGEAARDLLAEARARGIGGAQLERVERIALKAVHGPSWPRRHLYESEHYRVFTDIDKTTARRAANILEEAYAEFVRTLGPAPDAETRRFTVYLFRGQAGYLEYCEGLLAVSGERTAGLFNPTLRQLIIWNLPERDSMMRTVRHEGLHQYFDHITEAAPIWLNEGLAEYFEGSRVAPDRWREGMVRQDHLKLLRDRRTVALERFLFLSHDEFLAQPKLHYAQAWALVHFLRHGGAGGEGLFEKLWAACQQYGSARTAVRRALEGTDLGLVEEEFRAYLDRLG